MLAVNSQDKKLLEDIFKMSLKPPYGVSAPRFRADNEGFMADLDRLEGEGYLRRGSDNSYSVHPVVVAYLAKEDGDANEFVQKCGVVFTLLQETYRKNLGQPTLVSDIERVTGVAAEDVRAAIRLMGQTPATTGYSFTNDSDGDSVAPSESLLKYKTFDDVLIQQEEWDSQRQESLRAAKRGGLMNPEHASRVDAPASVRTAKAVWTDIEGEYGITKNSFARKFNFVKGDFKRNIIFRDVEQAFELSSLGFSKPAVILAGGVIEELLRTYLEHKGIKPVKDDFDGYIRTCEQERLLKRSVSRLSDSVRQFRNLVHIDAEKTKKHTISKATAKGAVSCIFTIANDF